MEWTKVEDAHTMTLSGIEIDVQKHDCTIELISLRDPDGHIYRIVAGGYGSGLRLLEPAKPKMVEVYRLHGTYLDITPVDMVFKRERDASDKLNKFAQAAEKDCDDIGLVITADKVPETELTAS